jgi:hypothetical protein
VPRHCNQVVPLSVQDPTFFGDPNARHNNIPTMFRRWKLRADFLMHLTTGGIAVLVRCVLHVCMLTIACLCTEVVHGLKETSSPARTQTLI